MLRGQSCTLAGAGAAFPRARGARHHAVVVPEVSPAVLADHYPAEFFVGGAEQADAFASFPEKEAKKPSTGTGEGG